MITTKRVSEISEKTFFFIPSYQRGYKWTTLQVEQLLSDIIEFEKTSSNNLNQSYCLQPIVLRQMNHSDERLKNINGVTFERDTVVYELVDGQQRLTTVFLILSFLNSRFKPDFATQQFQLFYQTREKSFNFLQRLSKYGLVEDLEKESNDNIDFHHIYKAYQFIHEFFTAGETKKDLNLFESTLLFRTKFIWYEVDQNETSSAEDIFKRLNSGKVELTNAELVKALFLGKFEHSTISDADRMQMSIEWNWIENKLNNNEFWYFLSNIKSEKNNRISFILDHFSAGREFAEIKKDDKRYTFLVFNKLFQEEHNVKGLWEELKQQFRIIHNWYNDHELFHYIGFLLSDYVNEKEVDLNSIFSFYEKAVGSISEFKSLLQGEIDEQVNQQELSSLKYNKDSYHIKKVLLWFNIAMILKDEKRNQRFNFFKFKDQKFDLEHIKSLDSEITKSEKSKNHFLTSFFNFYSKEHFHELKSELEIPENEHRRLLVRVYNYLNNNSSENFENILAQMKEVFDIEDLGDGSEEDHSIGNLCLLDETTNRGYGNAIFPIKRQTIIDNDLNGIYILPMTKSAFLKQFSGNTKNLLVWTEEDRDQYIKEIEKQLN